MFALLVFGRFGSGSKNMKKQLTTQEKKKCDKDRGAYQTKDRHESKALRTESSRERCLSRRLLK